MPHPLATTEQKNQYFFSGKSCLRLKRSNEFVDIISIDDRFFRRSRNTANFFRLHFSFV